MDQHGICRFRDAEHNDGLAQDCSDSTANTLELLKYCTKPSTWWRHQMETFSALLAICAGNSPVPGEFPAQRPVTRSFHVFFDLHLNKPLSKQSWGWWFETISRPLWRHCNGSEGSSATTRPLARGTCFTNDVIEHSHCENVCPPPTKKRSSCRPPTYTHT